jgi:ABC-type transport system substrate-binding protein
MTNRRHPIHPMPARDQSFIRKQMTRRSMLKTAGAFSIGTMGMSWVTLPGASASQTLPEGAASPENQVYRVASTLNVARTMDMYESIYDRPWLDCLVSVPLFKLNREFEIENAMVDTFESNEEGTVWTFKLLQDQKWSDGNPVTAADWVHTFQYAADPAHAWDFSWFWSGNILNFTEALEGSVALEDIGVRQGANEFELVFETIEPAPYLPIKLLYSPPMSKAAMDAHGPLYNSNPETQCVNGPWKMEEWAHEQYITMVRNEDYTGDKDAIPLQKLIMKFADATTHYTLYETGEIDFMEGPAPADLTLMESNPDTAGEIYQGVGDFASYYFFFDTSQAPFDDLKVRQAFSHAIDRDAMKQVIWTSQANPATSYLMPGFPASNVEALADIQAFDPEKAKALLAEAGYPEGEGFPKLTLNTRGGARPIEYATADAYGAMLKEHLNIDVEIQMLERPVFYEQMSAKPTQIQFGIVSYGMDYFDASNMLGVWVTGGRHPWTNEEYDRLIKEATVFTGDAEERTAMFNDAERILVEDVPAVFAYFYTPIQFIKPWVTGPAIEPDSNGIAAVHWPGYGTYTTVPEEMWISADAPEGRD